MESMDLRLSLIGHNILSDVRNYYSHRILSMGVRGLLYHLYPRLMSLHNLPESLAIPSPDTGMMQFPPLLRSTHTSMQAHGVYLLGTPFPSYCSGD